MKIRFDKVTVGYMETLFKNVSFSIGARDRMGIVGGNAPLFLADLNLSNLDIYSHGARIGRVKFCLVRDINHNALLLLDCLDGSERMLTSKSKFNDILMAIKQYAHWLGITLIKLNYDIDFNATPKQFIAHTMGLFKQSEQVDLMSRFFTDNVARHLIPYPSQTFLESFVQDSSAYVRGALINTKVTNIVQQHQTEEACTT